MSLYDDGYRPIRAEQLAPGDRLKTPWGAIETIRETRQRPELSRMIVAITEEGRSYNYVKTAQVWVR